MPRVAKIGRQSPRARALAASRCGRYGRGSAAQRRCRPDETERRRSSAPSASSAPGTGRSRPGCGRRRLEQVARAGHGAGRAAKSNGDAHVVVSGELPSSRRAGRSRACRRAGSRWSDAARCMSSGSSGCRHRRIRDHFRRKQRMRHDGVDRGRARRRQAPSRKRSACRRRRRYRRPAAPAVRRTSRSAKAISTERSPRRVFRATV